MFVVLQRGVLGVHMDKAIFGLCQGEARKSAKTLSKTRCVQLPILCQDSAVLPCACLSRTQ